MYAGNSRKVSLTLFSTRRPYITTNLNLSDAYNLFNVASSRSLPINMDHILPSQQHVLLIFRKQSKCKNSNSCTRLSFQWFYMIIISALATSVILSRILFILLTHSIGFSALSCSVTPSLSANCFTSRRKID